MIRFAIASFVALAIMVACGATPAVASPCASCANGQCSMPMLTAPEPGTEQAASSCGEQGGCESCRADSRGFHPLRALGRLLVRGHQRRAARRCRRR